MEGLSPSQELLRMMMERRQRGSYLEALLKFQLGRKPTQEEIAAEKERIRLSSIEREKEIAAMPWHKRKHYVSSYSRIERVLTQRYNVPKWLVEYIFDEWSPE